MATTHERVARLEDQVHDLAQLVVRLALSTTDGDAREAASAVHDLDGIARLVWHTEVSDADTPDEAEVGYWLWTDWTPREQDSPESRTPDDRCRGLLVECARKVDEAVQTVITALEGVDRARRELCDAAEATRDDVAFPTSFVEAIIHEAAEFRGWTVGVPGGEVSRDTALEMVNELSRLVEQLAGPARLEGGVRA